MTNLPPLHAVSSPETSPGRRLDSWKEIAAYLNRTIRTAQRWERTNALPVHRHEQQKHGSVYAFTRELDEWWSRSRLELESEEPRRAGRTLRQTLAAWRPGTGINRTWLAAGVLVGAALLIASWWLSRSSGRAALPFATRDWILVTDFDNQTGESVFDRSLLTAFQVGLQQSQHVNVVPPARAQEVLKRMGRAPATRIDEPTGREICLRENLSGLVSCGIAKVGRDYVLTARLSDPRTGAVVRAYSERAGEQDGILEALGKIVENIRQDLGESLASIRRSSSPLPQVTTASLEALRSYAEGADRWGRGAYLEAVRFYEAAVKEDPCFAMAHKALGSAYFSHIFNDPAKGKTHYEKALQCSERATRRERMLIQTAYERDQGHFANAVQLHQVYLAAFPDDISARYSLGTLLMRNRRSEPAIEQLKEVLRVDPAHSNALINIATSYRELGRSDMALPYYDKAFAAEPRLLGVVNVVHEYGFALAHCGNLSRAREIFEQAAAKPDLKPPFMRSLALLDMYEGRYRDARAALNESILLSEALRDALRSARARLVLAILLEGEGDRVGHLRELDRAEDALDSLQSAPGWLRMRIGAHLARAGAIDRADRIFRSVRDQVDRANLQESSALHLLEGELALARGGMSKAIETLSLADGEASTPETLASLANAYDKSGQVKEALVYYNRLVEQASPSLGWEAQQSWIAAHIRLAEIYQAQGESAKAASAVEAIFRLWKNADPGLPLARRIARLQGLLGA